jgi:tetratricopeptide (TPR) repeat protein
MLVCVSLAARAGFRCPAKGGPEWREYRSKHFVVQTDAEPSKVALLVAQLESIHALELQALVGEQVDIPGRLQVVAFANRSVFTDFVGKGVSAYLKSSSLGETTLVVPVQGLEADPQSVANEIARHLFFFLFPWRPAWFTEGLARFVQTVAQVESPIQPTGWQIVPGERDESGGVGGVPRLIGDALREVPTLSFKELFDWDGHDERASYYLYSWLLYHWLWNAHPKELAAFQQRLSIGDEPASAWRGSFPEFDPSNAASAHLVDHALELYRSAGRYVVYRVATKVDGRFEDVGPLSSAEVHMLIYDVAPSAARTHFVAHVDEALAEDESHPAAVAAKAAIDKTSALGPLRNAAKTHSSDWRAWMLLAVALERESKVVEQEAAYRKAISLNPDSQRAHNDLAWLLMTQGRAKEALPIANRALDLAPSVPANMDTLAVVAAELGKCSEALVLERRAAGMVPQDSGFAQRCRKRIADWQTRCGTAPSPAAAVAPSSAH